MKVEGDVDLDAADLLLLTDAIFIGLDNVKAHCGMRRDAKVHIRCNVNPTDGMLHLDVRNTVNAGARTEQAEQKLRQIRNLIREGNIGKGARKEGGSGFLKLAAALRYSAGGGWNLGLLRTRNLGWGCG